MRNNRGREGYQQPCERVMDRADKQRVLNEVDKREYLINKTGLK